MAEQLEMQLPTAPALDPDVPDLERFLREQNRTGKRWLTAEQISRETGWDDRHVRRLASQSDLIVASPGRPGYCHIEDIKKEEYFRARNSMRSQTRKMVARVVRWDRNFFRRHPIG